MLMKKKKKLHFFNIFSSTFGQLVSLFNTDKSDGNCLSVYHEFG